MADLDDDDHGDILAALGFQEGPQAKSGKSVQVSPSVGDLEAETGKIGRSAADILGLPDAMRALRGQMTPDEAQHFAMTSALGLIPGGKGENLLMRGAGKLAGKGASVLPHMGDLEEAISNLRGVPGYFQNNPIAKNALVGDVPEGALNGKTQGGWGSYAGSLPNMYNQAAVAQQGGTYHNALGTFPTETDKILDALKNPSNWKDTSYQPLNDSDIDKALAKNPGASIFDLAGHSEYNPPATKYAPREREDYGDNLSPIDDWQGYRSNLKQPPSANFPDVETRERARNTGFNVDMPLYKGGKFSSYPEELMDPAKKGNFEPGLFFSDNPNVSAKYQSGPTYGKPPLEYVARAKNPMEINWPDATGMDHYSEDSMSDIIHSARAKGADMLAIHGIDDIGGHQSQYVVLDPSIVRRPDAAFDPEKLNLNKLAAGIAGTAGAGGAASGFLSDDQGNTILQTK